MRLLMNDQREKQIETLVDATGENTKSKALDRAMTFYLQMHGDNFAYPHGGFPELLATAARQGSATVEEIADVLDTDELPVRGEVRREWSVGDEEE